MLHGIMDAGNEKCQDGKGRSSARGNRHNSQRCLRKEEHCNGTAEAER